MNEQLTIERPRWGWRDVLLVVALAIGGALLLALLSSLVLPAQSSGLASPANYVLTALVYGVLLLGIYLFGVRRADWAALGWRSAPAITYAATPLLLLLLLFGMAAVNLTIGFLQGQPFENPQIEALAGSEPFSVPQLLLVLLLVAGLVPVVEESFFRGMVYPLLRYQGGPLLAILVSGFLFAVVHLNPAGEGWEIFLLMPGLLIPGVLLGLLREWSGSVLPCILLHSLQNALGLLAINAFLATTPA